MPLDSQVEALLKKFNGSDAQSFEQLGLLDARVGIDFMLALQGEPRVVKKVRDILVPGSAGLLPARIYHPSPGTALPLMVFFHGGGWVFGNVVGSDFTCRALALEVNCVVASVEYRLSPETQYPGPFDDAYSAVRWLTKNAAELGADGSKTIVAGESAGGNLAAAVALKARDEADFALAHQLLIYPVLAAPWSYDFPSYRENAVGYLLTSSDMKWFWDLYIPSRADAENPYASPLKADDFVDLPSATILAPEFDPLRDEALAYSRKLLAAGTAVDMPDCSGLIHGFFGMFGILDQSRVIVAEVGRILRCRLSSATGE